MDPTAADDESVVPAPDALPLRPAADPAELLRIDLSTAAEHTTVLAAAGEVDQLTGPQLQLACEAAAGHRRNHLIIDLTEVTFMSSAGINVMVNLRRDYAAPLELHLVLPPSLARLWDLFGLTALFTIHPTRTAALAATDAG